VYIPPCLSELLKRSFKGNREVDKHMERQRGESTKSLTKRAFREAQSISGAAVLLRVSTNFLLKKYPELCAEFRKVNEKVKEVDGIFFQFR
jgi:hypothetical protein